MNPVQTYDPYDGRMIAREERIGGYVKLADYEDLEKRLAEIETNREKFIKKLVDMDDTPNPRKYGVPADLGERVLKAEPEMRSFVPPGGPVEATD